MIRKILTIVHEVPKPQSKKSKLAQTHLIEKQPSFAHVAAVMNERTHDERSVFNKNTSP